MPLESPFSAILTTATAFAAWLRSASHCLCSCSSFFADVFRSRLRESVNRITQQHASSGSETPRPIKIPVTLLPPGCHVVFHGRVFSDPELIVKDVKNDRLVEKAAKSIPDVPEGSCAYFAAGKRCKFGAKCRDRHCAADAAERPPTPPPPSTPVSKGRGRGRGEGAEGRAARQHL